MKKWLYILVCIIVCTVGGMSLHYIIDPQTGFFTQNSIAWSLIHAVLATFSFYRGMSSGERNNSKLPTELKKFLSTLLYILMTSIVIMNVHYICTQNLYIFKFANWFQAVVYGLLGGFVYYLGFSITEKPDKSQDYEN